MGPRLNLRRCARGSLKSFGNPAQYSQVALFNNSPAQDLLLVRGIFVGFAADYPPALFYIGGLQGASPSAGVPIVTGDAALPGQLTAYQTSTVPPADFYMAPVATQNSSAWSADFPIAVLQPGMSLVVSMIDPNLQVYAGFYWQAIHQNDLDGRHCPTCDVNITIAP
jgi:hypothetical protein